MAVAALLVLALTLPAPVSAQEETPNRTQTVAKDKDASGDQYQLVQGGEQQAEGSSEEAGTPTTARVADTLQRADALIIEDGSEEAGTVDRIEVDAADCEVDKGAVVTVQDNSSESASFTNAPDDGTRDGDEVEATIVAETDRVIIEVADDATLSSEFGTGDSDEDGTVTSSTGVTCGRDAGAAAADNADDGNGAKNAEDLEDLSCDELLVLFRGESSSGEQYADAAVFADSEVRARVEVCLEKEIVQGTAADEDLPDTGGLPLLAVAVLGFVSAAAGLSVIRGGRR
jgi:hypothetical protein